MTATIILCVLVGGLLLLYLTALRRLDSAQAQLAKRVDYLSKSELPSHIDLIRSTAENTSASLTVMENKMSAIEDVAAEQVNRAQGLVNSSQNAVQNLQNQMAAHRSDKTVHVASVTINERLEEMQRQITFLSRAVEDAKSNRNTSGPDVAPSNDLLVIEVDKIKKDLYGWVTDDGDRVGGTVAYGKEVRTRKANGQFGPTYTFERPE